MSVIEPYRNEIERLERALAVSQGEVERLREAGERLVTPEVLQATKDRLYSEIHALHGDRELARGLLLEQEWSMYDSSCGDYACRWCLALRGYDKGKHKPDCRLAAFLAPPTPTASPEPDRASPEVTEEENETP